MLLAATIALTLGQTCEFDARWWQPTEFAVPLPDGTPWATLGLGGDPRSAKAHVAFHSDGVAEVRMKANGLEVAFTSRDFPVTAKTQLTFAEVVTTSAATPLRVLRVRPDGVEVVPTTREDLEPAAPWEPATVRCDALALGRPMGPRVSLPPLARPLQVRAAPAGPPRLTLLVRSQWRVDRRDGGRAQVIFTMQDGTRIAGWSDDPGPGDLADGPFGGWGCLVAPESHPQARRCEKALPLSAAKEGRSEPIGTLDPRTGFFVRGKQNERVVIEPEQPWLTLLAGWELTVSEADLRACGDRPDGTSLKLPPAHLDQQ